MATLDVQNYIEDYGSELGETFFYVHTHWARLMIIFTQYANLFGKSQQRVELLNESAGSFFKNVQDTFYDEILLGICRLTDPAESRSRKDIHTNISVMRLEKLIEDTVVKEKISNLAAKAKSSADFARQQRDKKISHADLDVTTGKSNLKSGASILEMRQAIKSIHEVIFAICFEIKGVHQAAGVTITRSEFKLLVRLYQAQTEREELRKRISTEKRANCKYDYYPNWLFDDDEENNWNQ